MKIHITSVGNFLIVITILHFHYGRSDETVQQHELCAFRDLIFNVCDSSCVYKAIYIRFNVWKLRTPGLLSSTFPIDREEGSHVRKVKNALFSRCRPTPFDSRVQLAGLSEDVLSAIVNLDPEAVKADRSFLEFVSGRRIPGVDSPLCHRYGGHQFGIWAGQLGDGRAHFLGEYVTDGDGSRWELQLKGSGRTPYSRSGDGRAVLRSSVREFLASEAMHHLGIPTSRAASLVVSNDRVMRDVLYNGRVRKERTAIVLRLARSWFRIGSFELLASDGEILLLKQLTDFVIDNYYPDVSAMANNRYAYFFESVVRVVAKTTAQWQSVGFAHGVLNTDNVSILGLTIDFGPFRFIDEYDENLIPNSSDDEGRYSYGRQPAVMQENLGHLLRALLRLMTSEEYSRAEVALHRYEKVYWTEYVDAFRRKLGLSNTEMEDIDERLISSFLSMMSEQRVDFTACFRQLSETSIVKMSSDHRNRLPWALRQLSLHRDFEVWLSEYRLRLRSSGVSDAQRRAVMREANPCYVLRNWMAQEAIEQAESGDFTLIQSLQTVIRRPFEKQSVAERMGYSSPPPHWARNITVSCSS